MSKKPKKTEEAFTPEQLEKIESKGDKEVQLQRQKEGLFQRYTAKRDSKDLARQVRWKRRAGVALVVLVLVLLLVWLISWLMNTIGDLVITVDRGLYKQGIVISANEDGSDPQAQLSANMVAEVTNITYDWLPATLDLEADGTHNGRNYLAYTFYLSNNSMSADNPTKEPVKFQSTLRTVRDARSASEAVRILIYRNGVPTMYAKRNISVIGSDGKVYVDRDAPESDVIPLETRYQKVVPEDYTRPEATEPETNAEGETVNELPPQSKVIVDTTDDPLTIVEFVDDEVVFDVGEEELQPGETVKYTIVMWIEGDDPECVDEIRGGFIKLNWFFNVLEEEI